MANIKLNNNSYPIPDSVLAPTAADFVAHLGTIAGSGLKVVVGGVEYGVDAAKVSGAVTELEAVLGGLSNPDAPTPEEERLEGDGAEYYTLAPTTLSFRSTAPLNELQEVQINGVTVDPANYTLEEGSTIVTFPIDYLKTLNVGSYEVAVASEGKTVKGDFSVKAPELNEHGFYYNQPYSANLPMFGGDTAFFVREDGTYDIVTVGRYPETGNYTMNGNNIVATHPQLGTITCTISSDGTEVFCNELQVAFKLSNSTSIAADEDYIYVYKEELGGYEVKCIDKTKTEYGVIKTGIHGFPTRAIAEYAFNCCTNLTSITIPSCIEGVFNNAFAGCINLDEVIFENCKVYYDKEYVFPNSPLSKGISIRHSYFKNDYVCDVCGKCDHLHTEIVGKTDEYSGDVVCNDCGKTITWGGYYIPAGATYYIFSTDKTLTEGDIFPTMSGFSRNDIYNDGQCQYTYNGQSWSLTKAEEDILSYTIPEIINTRKVTSIGASAFLNCTSLISIIIPDSVTSIGVSAFYNTAYYNNVNNWADGVLYIGNHLIKAQNTISGEYVIKDGTVIVSDRAFSNCTSLTSVVIPDSVIEISEFAFYECSSLTNVAIGNGVTTIRYGMFSGCSNLTSVVIPDSVTNILNAFDDCTSLTEITFKGTTTQWYAVNYPLHLWQEVPATYVQCSDGQVALQ